MWILLSEGEVIEIYKFFQSEGFGSKGGLSTKGIILLRIGGESIEKAIVGPLTKRCTSTR
jgi:hypothetical protein